MVEKLPFKVSAKAARLIGRESVSNAEGALGELIKNTYDADASNCAICFVERYTSPPKSLSSSEYVWILKKHDIISKFFKLNKNKKKSKYILKDALSPKESTKLQDILRDFVDLWIIDNGIGMSASTIRDCWMVIGTDFKEEHIFSNDGRTYTGAKGIGRFALDRLGAECEILSYTKSEGAISWKVNWGDFEGSGKTLDEVKAELTDIDEDISFALDSIPPINQLKSDLLKSHFKKKNTGTFIRIGLLRDEWDQKSVERVEKSLEALTPPVDQKPLILHLFSSQLPTAYHEINRSILDDYDYRMDATFDGDKVKFDFYRNELVFSEINPGVFDLEDMQKKNFNQKSLKKKKITYTKKVNALFPGLNENQLEEIKEVGNFNFNLLFFKKSMPGGKEKGIYPYRPIRSGPRKKWLEENGGIKIYRDNFIVRPYGESKSKSFDWLSLGERVAGNPAAASRKGWRVGPQNLAGTIHISRITNPDLYDQLTREGFIENKSFRHFKSVVLKLIQEFENDRSQIHYNLKEIHLQENQSEKAITEGAETAERIANSPDEPTPEDAKLLAKAFEAQQEEIRELLEEQSMLRSLATLGTVLVSFSHEMGQLQNAMSSRTSDMAHILDSYIGPDDLGDIKPAFHPYKILEDWAEDDKKVKQWFTFALSSIRADKRRRRWISLPRYIKKSEVAWHGFLNPREISLEITIEKGFIPEVKAFEIDLDSIFNNLLLNSVEALLSKKHRGKRKIWIKFMTSEENGMVKIIYTDNGPGLHQSIESPKKIFDFNYTTKVDSDGKESGTGLGMWILEAVVREYGGTVKAYNKTKSYGFKSEITLPMKGGK